MGYIIKTEEQACSCNKNYDELLLEVNILKEVLMDKLEEELIIDSETPLAICIRELYGLFLYHVDPVNDSVITTVLFNLFRRRSDRNSL